MSNLTVRRLSDFTKSEEVRRGVNRSRMGWLESCSDAKTCKKPIWITCFFDGTGNNFEFDGNGELKPHIEKYSNIAKLAKFCHVENNSIDRIYGLYAPGVGTPFLDVGDSGGGLDKALGMAQASKGQARITWMLDRLKQRIDVHMPHVNQVNVAVFGFSRGAAQARAFVRQLAAQCQQQDDHLVWVKSVGSVPPRIEFYFLGIFDTVASVGFGGSRFESALPIFLSSALPIFPGGLALSAVDNGGHSDWASDLRIPWYVRKCEHYVAAHEVREKFPSDSVRDNQAIPENCREVFYPGAHSDVGGGYDDMNQEGRSNHLSRIPLCNMFLTAYSAGVPFDPPSKILKEYGSLFMISTELASCFKVYVKHVETNGTLEKQVISHMGCYYHWRWGRTERQRAALKERQAMIARGEAVMYATPDAYMTTTDREWEADVQNIAKKKTGLFRSSTEPLEDVIFDAWTGKLRKSMPTSERDLFDKFFDRYVHDSVAGFKNQMSDSSVGIIEFSRWSRNRQYFLGKRGKKFLYWRYEGVKPHASGAREAMLLPKDPTGGQAAIA